MASVTSDAATDKDSTVKPESNLEADLVQEELDRQAILDAEAGIEWNKGVLKSLAFFKQFDDFELYLTD